jgi:hypothetical protein
MLLETQSEELDGRLQSIGVEENWARENVRSDARLSRVARRRVSATPD